MSSLYVVLLVLIIVFLLLPTLVVRGFCRYMQDKRITAKVEQSVVNDGSSTVTPKKNNPLKSLILRFIESLVFLYAKSVGSIPSHALRNFLYKYVLRVRIGKNAVIYHGLEIRSPWNLVIGQGSIIGDYAVLDARYGITIEDNVNLSSGVWIWTLQHDANSSTFSTEGEEGSVLIKRHAWVSSRTTILPGCTVAEGAVLAAGAVLTRSIDEPFTIWGGLPARRIGQRNNDLIYEFNGTHRFFL